MEYFTAHSEDRVNNFEMHFDDERPPIYNAEDYAVHLRKFTKMTGAQLYSSVKKNRSQSRSEKKNSKNRFVPKRDLHTCMDLPSTSQCGKGVSILREFLYHCFIQCGFFVFIFCKFFLKGPEMCTPKTEHRLTFLIFWTNPFPIAAEEESHTARKVLLQRVSQRWRFDSSARYDSQDC